VTLSENVEAELLGVETAVSALGRKVAEQSTAIETVITTLIDRAQTAETKVTTLTKKVTDLEGQVAALQPAPAPAPTAPPTLYGASVGVEGWPAVANYETKVGKPAVIRTYAAGGIGKMLTTGASKYPGVPQVYGPKVIAAKLTDAAIVTELKNYDNLRKNMGGKLWLCIDPEHDRHIAKDGQYTMAAYTAEMKRWFDLAKAQVPGMVDWLWTNPTGYQASARFATYIKPVLPYIAGIAVDGYIFAKEGTLTQASTTDMTWAANYAKSNGKRFAMFEQGVEAGTNQAEQLKDMLAVVDATKPEVFVYWETYFSDGSLDCRLSTAAAKVLSDHIAAAA
jgi:hypothetical protein